MQRAHRNLQLSHNVISHDDVNPKAHRSDSIAGVNLKTIIIYGLHKFDPSWQHRRKLLVVPKSSNRKVHFVFGDCTNSIKGHSSEPTMILSCVDNSGKLGKGSMFVKHKLHGRRTFDGPR